MREMESSEREEAMVAWVRRRADSNGSQLARDLKVGQATISRWNNSGALALTDRLREAVTAYWDENGITVDALDGPDVADTSGAGDAPSERGEAVERRERGETGDKAGPSRSRSVTEDDAALVEEPVRPPIPLSVLPRVERASSAQEIADETGVPVLAWLSVNAARKAAQELAAGWQWKRDAAPVGVHGDALLYMHTREPVSFEDRGAMDVAFAENTRRFACGLSAAEMRFGVAPRLRQERYAVRDHWERPMLIGSRLAALIPARAYEDEDWFFGSSGRDRHGNWMLSAAELIARRRVLQAMVAAWEGTPRSARSRVFVAASLELLEIEATLLGPPYEMTFGEQVVGHRTWPPSTRLGIETDWRVAEIRRLEAMIRPGVLGRMVGSTASLARSLAGVLTWLPSAWARRWSRLILRKRGLWDAIFDSPYRRAAVVVRGGVMPSRRAVWAYRLLRRLAGVFVLSGQVLGRDGWQPAVPPWSEQYQRRFRSAYLKQDYKPKWRPWEFDGDYNMLPLSEMTPPRPKARPLARRLASRLAALRPRVATRRGWRHLGDGLRRWSWRPAWRPARKASIARLLRVRGRDG